MKKCYYAHPISLYNTPQELRDINVIKEMGYEVINPNKVELEEKYKEHGFDVFISEVEKCDVLCFRSFPCGKIPAGVKKEIDTAYMRGLAVFELPSIIDSRVLSVNDTREYLKLLGAR